MGPRSRRPSSASTVPSLSAAAEDGVGGSGEGRFRIHGLTERPCLLFCCFSAASDGFFRESGRGIDIQG
jgi:hypothetical protein